MHVRGVIAAALGLAVAGFGGLHAAALALGSRHPASALRLSPLVAEAHVREAETARNGQSVRDRARSALRLRPLDGRAYRQLASVAPVGRRERLYRIAASVSPRDAAARAWLTDFATAADRPAEAVDHLVALLDSRTALYDPLFPILAAWAGQPDARPAVFESLAHAPAWRDGFLDWWTRQPVTDRAGLRPALGYLQARGALGSQRGLALSKSMLAIDEPLPAVLLEPRASHTRASLDPRFAGIDGPALGWRTSGSAGWSITPRAGGEHGLDVWVSRQAAAPGLVQAVLLPAGIYRLRARATLHEGPAEAVQFQLQCPGTSPIAVPWTRVGDTLHINAPLGLERGCEGGQLQLTPAPGQSGWQQVHLAIDMAQLMSETALGENAAMPRSSPAAALAWVQSGRGSARRDGRLVALSPGSLIFASDVDLRSLGATLVAERLDGCRLLIGDVVGRAGVECAPARALGRPRAGQVQAAVMGAELSELPTFAP